MKPIFFLLLLLSACQQKQPEPPVSEEKDSTAPEEETYSSSKQQIDYQEVIGVYDHESTTKGFAAVLSLRENGNDLYFYVSVAQGNCKGETEGVVIMVEQTENYFSGFYESDDCPLQFTFSPGEKKVDIKAVTFCKPLEKNCSYEGTYVKRKD
ncbi:MAG: hypothetical protein WAZ98_02100 [Cyclobacteriaceae bacterium]